MYDLVVEDATIVSGWEPRRVADICVEHGRIVHVGDGASGAARARVSAAGKLVMPGVIDGHVHFRSPGHPHKEDWASGSRAAASGGVTTVLDMPNTNPPTLTRMEWEQKRALAAEHSRVNFGIWVGASAGRNDAINELMDSGDACGIKVFMGASTGPLLVDDDTLVRLFEQTRGLIGVHAEEESVLEVLRTRCSSVEAPNHNVVRPPVAATIAVRRLIELVEAHLRPVHICHLSTEAESDLVEAARGVDRRRLPITTEICPHHLYLSADLPAAFGRPLENGATTASGNWIKVNPPIRDDADRRAMWSAVQRQRIDTIGSDHAPHTMAEKALPYWSAPSGIPGVETTLPLLLTAVRQGRITLERVVQLCCEEPARVFGLKAKGAIREGHDADFVVLGEPDLRPLTSDDIVCRVAWSPFEGMPMVPKPDAVYVAGRLVASHGRIVDDDVRGSLTRPGA